MTSIAIKWTKQIIHSIPDSILDADGRISEVIEEMGEMLQEFEDDTSSFDADLLNRELGELKERMQGATVKGKAVTVRDNLIQTIVLPNGWEYWKELDPEDTMSVITHEKGAGGIRFETIELNIDNVEGVRVLEGIGEKIEWDMFRIELDGQPSIYFGSIPAWQLDLVSTVPALEKSLKHRETARRVIDPKRKKDHWQRQLNKHNKNSISAFFDRQETFFANPVILHMQSEKFITIETEEGTDNSKVSVELGFIDPEDNTSFTPKGEDMRPFTIIDGQHRIRGAANARNNHEQRVLVVLLPSQLAEHAAGKLFAEINTLSVPLNDKHRMFLAHRFMVSSPEVKFTFGKWKPEDRNTHRDRANRISYEMAARLLLNSSSDLLDDGIKFLKQNTKTQQVIDIEKWVEYSFEWFLGYPYTVESNISRDDMFTEIDNYFSAWDRLLGVAWEDNKVDACLFKSKTQVRVLLTRFQQVYELAKAQQPSSIISEETFYSVLLPLKHIPFTHETILKQFSIGLPEQSWKFLDAWVHDAIKAQSQCSREEILNSDLRGEPGAGIIALPPKSENWHFEIVNNDGLDPSDGNARYLNVRRPTNVGWTCNPEIWHNGEKLSTNITVKSKYVYIEENIPIRNRYPLPDLDENVVLKINWSTIAGTVDEEITIR